MLICVILCEQIESKNEKERGEKYKLNIESNNEKEMREKQKLHALVENLGLFMGISNQKKYYIKVERR